MSSKDGNNQSQSVPQCEAGIYYMPYILISESYWGSFFETPKVQYFQKDQNLE